MDGQKPSVIVGGGIAGLSAAFYADQIARAAGKRPNITVLERGSRWGGMLWTEWTQGFVIEASADAILARKPWALALCEELGLMDQLISTRPDTRETYILKGGRLHAIPKGLYRLLPTSLPGVLESRLFSWRAKLRLGLDWVMPVRAETEDESLRDFFVRRLGCEIYDYLLEPLLSGVYGGDGARLSLDATFPFFRQLEREFGGLLRGVRSLQKAELNGGALAKTGRSRFMAPRRGMRALIEALIARLAKSDVALCLNSGVERIEWAGSQYRVILETGKTMLANAVVLAVPAYAGARLLRSMAPALADELDQIAYAPAGVVSLAYQERDLPGPLNGYGYVIPRVESRAALACTWTSSKWTGRAPAGAVLLRVYFGGAVLEARPAVEDLIALARDELADTMGIHAEPLLTRANHWERGMPQYSLGHLALLQRIEELLSKFPNLALAGSAYRGVGLPDCVLSGKQAARLVAETAD